MLRRLAPLALATATALASLPLLATPAHAESTTIDDVARDVTYGQTGEPVEVGVDGERSADLRAATLTHDSDTIRIVVRVRKLVRRGGVSPNAAGYLRTPDGSTYRVNRTASPGGGLYSEVVRETDDRDEYVCSAIGRRSPARNEISYTIDRGCLGDPEWLRFGASTANTSDDYFGLLVDDARRDGDFDGRRARIGGPRVYAG